MHWRTMVMHHDCKTASRSSVGTPASKLLIGCCVSHVSSTTFERVLHGESDGDLAIRTAKKRRKQSIPGTFTTNSKFRLHHLQITS